MFELTGPAVVRKSRTATILNLTHERNGASTNDPALLASL
jgi:hypothetical protein